MRDESFLPIIRDESFLLTMGETHRAMTAVDWAANEEWREAAKVELVNLAKTRATLTANDLTLAMNKRSESTHDKRAIGPIMAWGRKHGLIERTGQYAPGLFGHLKPTPIWRSCVVRG